MNPLTNMKNVVKLSEQELYTSNKTSWHDQYRDSAWIFVGGLPYDLTEGDIICIFSQYGEIVNINLVRAKDTGKSKGFCFICYEDQRSTVLAVDNFNGIKILNKTIRVDHVSNYKAPKVGKKTDDETEKLYNDGCAPKASVPMRPKTPPGDFRETIADVIQPDIKLPARLPIFPVKQEPIETDTPDVKKEKKKKKKSKKNKKKSKDSTDESDVSSDSDTPLKSKGKKKKSTKYLSDKNDSHSDAEVKGNKKQKIKEEKDLSDNEESYRKSRKDKEFQEYKYDRENKYKQFKKEKSRSRSRSPRWSRPGGKEYNSNSKSRDRRHSPQYSNRYKY
ncbi:RNA-binding motif protein, X-linked 2 [Aethina tumida]|uniref:RNA-binding motif protein, X-linked 2 n=1 Tax=Aethina tumida TaxID=116153 RepID=UPI00096AEC97|nr:RNA-binding motif protein, X-linked 2 [Aethina tumida]